MDTFFNVASSRVEGSPIVRTSHKPNLPKMAATMCTKNVVNIAKIASCVTRLRMIEKVWQQKRTCSLVSNTISIRLFTSEYVQNSPYQYHIRTFSSTNVNKNGISDIEVKKGMEQLTDKFTEARELMEDAVKNYYFINTTEQYVVHYISTGTRINLWLYVSKCWQTQNRS